MILIKGGLIRPVTSPDIENGEILIDNGKIVAIGKDVEAPNYVQVIDATGMLVAPGFIDGHCHIGMSEEASRWEGNDCNEYSGPGPRLCRLLPRRQRPPPVGYPRP